MKTLERQLAVNQIAIMAYLKKSANKEDEFRFDEAISATVKMLMGNDQKFRNRVNQAWKEADQEVYGSEDSSKS